MFRALHTTAWVQTVRTVLIAVVLVCGFSFSPSSVEAQTSPRWAAFPRTIEAARTAAAEDPKVTITQATLNAVTCPPAPGEQFPTCTGSEPGTGIGMTSQCSLRGDNSANWCNVSFADKRYKISINNLNFSSDVRVEVSVDTTGGAVDPDAPERPPAGWTCSPTTEGQYGCDCTMSAPRGDQPGGDLICRSPYVTQITDLDPGGGDTTTVTQNPDGTSTTETETPANDNSCSFWRGGNLGDCLMGIVAKVGATVLWLFVQVFMVLIGLVGVLFNWILLVTVFQYATYFGNSEGLLMAWSVLRDLGNIFLLFGFIFIGLQTILNIGHFSVGKALPRLLIFAILINFSLFVSSAIVDVSNVFSAGFYSGISGGVNCGAGAEGSVTAEECTGTGISGKIQAASGLGNIADSSGGLDELWMGDGTSMFITYFCLLIFGIVMLVVLLAACIMLIIRAITLMFLLVLSPLGFAATAIPQFEEYSKMWWNKLLSQAFFAPMLLLMLFVGLKIMDGANRTFNPTGASLTTAFADGGTSAGGIFISFALIIGFMIGSLMIASKMGAMGASFATRQAGGVVLGGIGFVGRRTGGIASASAAGAIAKNRRSISRVIGRNNTMALFGAMKKGSESSFDPRTGTPGKLLKSATGLDFGAPGKAASHGIHGIEEAAEKKRKDFADKLELNDEQKRSLKDIKDSIEEQGKKDRDQMAELDARHSGERDPYREKIKEQREAAEKATGPAKQQAEEALGNTLREYDILMREQGEEKKRVENEQKSRMDTLKDDEKSAANRAKLDYAEDLRDNTNRRERYLPLSIGSHVDHSAADAIDKKLNQSDADRILEKLDKVEKNSAKGTDSHAAPAAGPKAH